MKPKLLTSETDMRRLVLAPCSFGKGPWASFSLGCIVMHCKYLSPQTKKYADVIIPRGADNLGESPWGVLLWDVTSIPGQL